LPTDAYVLPDFSIKSFTINGLDTKPEAFKLEKISDETQLLTISNFIDSTSSIRYGSVINIAIDKFNNPIDME
jgi:hypothetical protein